MTDLDEYLARMHWQGAPPDPGIKPGGIRDRAMRAQRERGPMPEDPEKTRQSQEYWAKFRADREKSKAAATGNTAPKNTSTETLPMPHSTEPKRVWFACRNETRGWVIDATPSEGEEWAQALRENGVLLPGEFASPDEAFAAVLADMVMRP
jgi:hypothetical protein